MNDSEIIKALECCKNLNCSVCPKKTNIFVTDCDVKLCEEAIDLINRQQAEIDRLNAESQVMRNATKVYTSEINCLREEIKNLETTLNSFVSPKNTEV